jgi:hypothetical protein
MTQPQNKILSEIYRRLNFLHDGNLNEPLLLLAFPSEVKSIKPLGIITPYSTETPKVLNWYRLTPKGKSYFANYVTKITEATALEIFTGKYVKEFINPDKL